MSDRFGGYDTNRERDLLDSAWRFLEGDTNREKNREEAAERRHKELLAKADTIVAAFTAGLRAFADTVDRQMRR